MTTTGALQRHHRHEPEPTVMKTFLVAALFSATAAIAAPTPTKAPATQTKTEVNASESTDVQADPHAPSKTESKTEVKTETKPSGRTQTIMQGTTKKPVDNKAATEKAAQ
ncbi:hypothetical protein [Corallococcus aberystwythensis]|nr:hypothetical protein [Corallococcus aberystwythensis]